MKHPNFAYKVAWYGESRGRGSTHPVGKKKKNGYGLFDLSGNVWEWTVDKWHSNYKGAPTDGTAWSSEGSSFRVYRGGGWDISTSVLRVANRGKGNPSNRRSSLGFRIIMR